MNVANRMNLLGTESAFDVLVKARALEAQGHDDDVGLEQADGG